MMRKFYDVAAPEAPAAPAFNPAEYMARQGARTDVNTTEVPDIKTPDKATSDAPAGQPAVAEEAREKAPEATPAKPAAAAPTGQVPEADWKQHLKKAPEAEVLKELGYDEKLVGLLNRWKTGGSVTEYLEAAQVDYQKMTAAEVMKRHLRQEYPDLSNEDFEELYRMNVTEHYKLDPDMFTEQEVKRGNILLNAQAKRVREELIQKQQEYLLPKAPDNKPVTLEDLEKEQEASRVEAVNQYKAILDADPYVKEVMKNGSLTIGEGAEAFNYTVDGNKLTELLLDVNKWRSLLKNEDGTLNIKKQMLLSAVVLGDKSFLDEYAKHCKRLGANSVADAVENAVPPVGSPASAAMPDLSPAAALAKGGVIVSGG